jgi:succinate dehydrogenase/fumarate reductase flavoprotein subunit
MNCDLAVVACGAGGLAACAQAAELGLKVIGIEKGKQTGGAANGGMGLLGINTDVQKRDLNSISVDEAFRMFMDYTHWRVDANLVRNYFGRSADTIRWLEDMGVEFYKAARYFPGSEATWHIVMPENRKPGPGSAATMMKILTQHAKDLGAEFLMETSAEHLIQEDGRVVGVFPGQESSVAHARFKIPAGMQLRAGDARRVAEGFELFSVGPGIGGGGGVDLLERLVDAEMVVAAEAFKVPGGFERRGERSGIVISLMHARLVDRGSPLKRGRIAFQNKDMLASFTAKKSGI